MNLLVTLVGSCFQPAEIFPVWRKTDFPRGSHDVPTPGVGYYVLKRTPKNELRPANDGTCYQYTKQVAENLFSLFLDSNPLFFSPKKMLLLLCFQTHFIQQWTNVECAGMFYPENQGSAVPLLDFVGLKVHMVLKEMEKCFVFLYIL